MPSEIKLILGDCMDGMHNTPDKFYDLAICDPPYSDNWMQFDYATGRTRAKHRHISDVKISRELYKSPTREYFLELFRISKNQIMWGANHYISKTPLDSSCWIVWDKNNTGNFSDGELAWTSFKTALRIFKFTWNGMLQEHNGRHKEIRQHPTQKPVALYKWLLKNYAKEGNKILDTHLGSGSIAIACYDMGYDLTGFEIDKEYYDAAVKRLDNHKKQLTFL